MKEIKIGVTGTRYGLSELQVLEVMGWLQKPFWNRDYVLTEFHHGDCIGADAQVASMVRENHPNAKIISHPPVKTELRAYFESDEEVPAKSYFARNRDIVNSVDMIIGLPSHRNEDKGGSWYTINYAVKLGKRVGVFHADGEREKR